MKKFIFALYIFVLILGFTACSDNTVTFQIPAAAKIELRSGLTGDFTEITNSADIEHITDNINALLLSSTINDNKEKGWAYSIKWYDMENNLLESITIVSETQISKGEYYYYCVDDNKIDTEFLYALFDDAQ